MNIRVTSLALFLTALAVATSHAQQKNPCEWLMRYGIYDSKQTGITVYKAEHFRNMLRFSEAKTMDLFRRELAGANLKIGPVKAGGGREFEEKKFEAWKQDLLSMSNTSLSTYL